MATTEEAHAAAAAPAAATAPVWEPRKHARYFKFCLNMLPSHVQSQDPNRMTLAFFALSGLDVLGELDAAVPHRAALVDWIYAQQVLPARDGAQPCAGFRGGPYLGAPFAPACAADPASALFLDGGHLAMTYTALASLAILGDDYGRVRRAAVAQALAAFQQPDGAFAATPQGGERDVRFVYCACAVAAMLNDWRGIDRAAAVRFVRSCLSYDGAFAQAPGLEAHGGYTFCALASLALLGELDTALAPAERARVAHWLVARQETGFNGRPHKPVDTCYSFWVAAALTLLGHGDWIDQPRNTAFLLTTQGRTGGLAKWPDHNAGRHGVWVARCRTGG